MGGVAYNMTMVTKKSTPAKKQAAAKKPAVRKKAVAVKVKNAPDAQKVDIYPNRMTVAVSALAGTVLLLVTIIAAFGARG